MLFGTNRQEKTGMCRFFLGRRVVLDAALFNLSRSCLLLDLHHLSYHLIPLRHRVPGHFRSPGDGAVVRLAGVELHVHPDFPLRVCELLRGDSPHPVPGRLPLRVHLLDQRFQLLLALLPGMGVDALGVLGPIRPGGGVASLEEMVVKLVDASGAGFAGAPRRRLEGFLPGRFRIVFLHLVAEAAVDFGRGLALHLAGDVGVDVQGRGRRHVPQHGGEGLDVHAVLQRHGSEGVTQVRKLFITTKTKRKKKTGSYRKTKTL